MASTSDAPTTAPPNAGAAAWLAVYVGTQELGATREYSSQLAAAAVVMTLAPPEAAPTPVFARRSQKQRREQAAAQRRRSQAVHKLWSSERVREKVH